MKLKEILGDERLPWFPCVPSKLLGALSAMSPDQQLVYVTVLLRIYEVRGPCPDPLDAIARRTQMNKRRASDALDALFRTGKLVRAEGGIHNPYARKILSADEALREERQRAGAEGGKRAAEKRKGKQGQGASNPTPRAKQKGTDLDLEVESLPPSGGRVSEPAGAGLFAAEETRRSDWPKDFREQFWKQFPRKTEKKAALAKLEAVWREGKVPWARFFGGVLRYAAHVSGTEEKYVKHPATWLNRGCWDDEFAGTNGRPPEPPRETRNGRAALAVRLARERAEGGSDGRNGNEDDGRRDAGAGFGPVPAGSP